MTSILVSPEKRNSELASQLERSGLRIIAWPPVQLDPALNQFALDDAIGNLFGYDWLILKSAPAAQFFLKRFTEAGRSVDELDGLRVWAIGEQTIASLREPNSYRHRGRRPRFQSNRRGPSRLRRRAPIALRTELSFAVGEHHSRNVSGST